MSIYLFSLFLMIVILFTGIWITLSMFNASEMSERVIGIIIAFVVSILVSNLSLTLFRHFACNDYRAMLESYPLLESETGYINGSDVRYLDDKNRLHIVPLKKKGLRVYLQEDGEPRYETHISHWFIFSGKLNVVYLNKKEEGKEDMESIKEEIQEFLERKYGYSAVEVVDGNIYVDDEDAGIGYKVTVEVVP